MNLNNNFQNWNVNFQIQITVFKIEMSIFRPINNFQTWSINFENPNNNLELKFQAQIKWLFKNLNENFSELKYKFSYSYKNIQN